MQRITNIFTVFMVLTVFRVSAGGPTPEKIKKNIIGTWKFSQLWNPYKNDGEPGKKSSDPDDLYTAYTFFEDGHVTIWSLDTVALPMRPNTATWGVVLLKNSKGKETPVLKIVDSSIDPKDQKTIEISTSGLQYLVVQSSKSFLAWIKIPQYKQANSRDWQSTFGKVPDMPPTK